MGLLDVLLTGGGASTGLDAPAVRAGAAALSRRSLTSEVSAVARRLAGHGITEDTCVLFRTAPGIDFVTHLLATWSLGAQPFVVDHRIPDAVLADLAPLAGAGYELSSASSPPPARGFTTASTEVRRIGPGSGRRTGHLVVHLSSGTTAEPKLIGRTEADVLAELDGYRALGGLGLPGTSAVLACAPASAWGVYGGLVATLGSGLEVVFPVSTTARGIFDAVADSDRRAVVLGVPIHVSMLMSATEVPDRLTGVVTSGAGLSPAQAAASPGGRPVGQVYGSTEIGLIAADPHGEAPGTAGRLRPDLRTRLGARDELEVARDVSPYLDRDADGGRWDAGWFRTHDAVEVDESGLVTVLGRLDGLISLGGQKFHVTEVEHHLRRDEAVEDVVVFVDGGRVQAFVTVVPGQRLDEDRAKARLPEHMRPHAVRVVPQLPRGASGKVLRRRELLPDDRGPERRDAPAAGASPKEKANGR